MILKALLLSLCINSFSVSLAHSESREGSGSMETSTRPYRISEMREACRDYDRLRQPFFGDTHIHTTHSQDASTQGTRMTPDDAYRFAKGHPAGIQPFDSEGRALRSVMLDRPLDFAVVTDHGEQIGEVHICKTPDAPGYDSWVCWMYREFPRVSFFIMNARYAMLSDDRWGYCGQDGENCLTAADTVWTSTQEAAEEAYDRSEDCQFTSFVGYEWTTAPGGGGHLHRNVIFRNERVVDLPISKMETGLEAINLWKELDRQCSGAGDGCEAITIPHNSNLSKGYAFTSAAELGGEIGSEEALLRNRYDRLAEVMQHKGDSECAISPGSSDEACQFEKVAVRKYSMFGPPEPLQQVDYVRDALKRGLDLEEKLGVNPLKYGMIASTDTHLGTPGLTEEKGHPGHGGAGKYARDEVPVGLVDNLEFNPGGLAVLWAEDKSRDSLFESMLRREVYGTSGTRPVLRFFGGWDYPEDLCDQSDFIEHAYAHGVPMGGDLSPVTETSPAPTFAVSALRDPSKKQAPLERIEIIKGWLEDGELREKVITVAGGDTDGTVDLGTCTRKGTGHSRLCTVWQDPDFDSAQSAFYYARAFENPSCRWSQWACVEAGVVCSDPSTISEGFEPCCAESHQPVIQERAWSSPIWYSTENSPEAL
ncbi:MAG: hypothetical protein CL917_15850 [Deltaproteobacteria bacterium]|nr:hypothetical protein [Deltaproteobacteria bacterium]